MKKKFWLVTIFSTCITVFLFTFYLNKDFRTNSVLISMLTSTLHHDDEISSEVFDKKSSFYGMIYAHTYGMVNSNTDNYSKNLPDWRDYFPKMVSGIKALEKDNPLNNPKLFTQSASISVKKNVYKFGDEFMAVVTSRDGEGRAKKFGGDYYRARLIRGNTQYPDGIPCRVIDKEDGTYIVKAPLVLDGELVLDITLVASIEVIRLMNQETAPIEAGEHKYFATLERGENVQCDVNLSVYDSLQNVDQCDYSNPRNNEPWFCIKPRSGKCSKITYIESFGLRNKPNYNVELICLKHGCHRNFHYYSINVQRQSIGFSKGAASNCQNPFANGLSFNGDIITYIENMRWKPIKCTYKLTSLKDLKNKVYLEDKVVYLFGDSTVRQFFYLFVHKLNLKAAGPDNSVYWQQPRIGYDDASNITLYYRAHGPPLRNPGPPKTRPYISDSVIGIPVGGKNVIVVIHVGPHLFFYEPRVYVHRLQGIRNAILIHHNRFPDTKFIVKGLNVVPWTHEWNIHRFEVILKKLFENMRNVAYLNFWDMTTVWPSKNGYHPPDPILDEQGLLLLNYVCF